MNLVTEYTSTFTINGVKIDVLAKVWQRGNEVYVDIWVSENGEIAWTNPGLIFSLKDAATKIRNEYKAKGLRIKWVKKDIDSTESA